VVHAESGENARGYQSDHEAGAETEHEREAQAELPELHAHEQRARHQQPCIGRSLSQQLGEFGHRVPETVGVDPWTCTEPLCAR
jgi:hypothetical protein